MSNHTNARTGRYSTLDELKRRHAAEEAAWQAHAHQQDLWAAWTILFCVGCWCAVVALGWS